MGHRPRHPRMRPAANGHGGGEMERPNRQSAARFFLRQRKLYLALAGMAAKPFPPDDADFVDSRPGSAWAGSGKARCAGACAQLIDYAEGHHPTIAGVKRALRMSAERRACGGKKQIGRRRHAQDSCGPVCVRIGTTSNLRGVWRTKQWDSLREAFVNRVHDPAARQEVVQRGAGGRPGGQNFDHSPQKTIRADR